MRTYGNVGSGTNAGEGPDLTRTLSGLPLGDMAPVRTGTGLMLANRFSRTIHQRNAARKRLADAHITWTQVRAWALAQPDRWKLSDVPRNTVKPLIVDAYFGHLEATSEAAS